MTHRPGQPTPHPLRIHSAFTQLSTGLRSKDAWEVTLLSVTIFQLAAALAAAFKPACSLSRLNSPYCPLGSPHSQQQNRAKTAKDIPKAHRNTVNAVNIATRLFLSHAKNFQFQIKTKKGQLFSYDFLNIKFEIFYHFHLIRTHMCYNILPYTCKKFIKTHLISPFISGRD